MPGDEDSDIWQRACSGDREAFDAMQRALSPEVAHFTERLLGRPEPVEEICQDAFLALYRNLQRLGSAAHVRPFLFRVVRNLCYDALRRQRRFDHQPIVEGDARSAQELAWVRKAQRQPEEDLLWSLAMSWVHAAMEQLPEPHRQALILRFEMGLTYREVGETLGVDTGTAKSRVYYGRRSLRRLLGPEFLASLGLGSTHSSEEEER